MSISRGQARAVVQQDLVAVTVVPAGNNDRAAVRGEYGWAESQASATLLGEKKFRRRLPAEAFAWTVIDQINNTIYIFLRNQVKVETFGKKETQ